MRHQRVQERWSSHLDTVVSRMSLELGHLLAIAKHPVPPSPASLCSCRNILSIINEFDFPELSISREEYPNVLMALNATQAERVARLPLKTCLLEDFLDKVGRGRGAVPGNQGHIGRMLSYKRLGTHPTGNHRKAPQSICTWQRG